jgi:hypothetical protein
MAHQLDPLPTELNDSVVASAYEPSVPLYRRSATGENIMPNEHDKIDSQKVIGSLNTILELDSRAWSAICITR